MFRIIVMEILILWGCYAGYMAVLVHKRGSIGGDWLMMVGNPAYHGTLSWLTGALARTKRTGNRWLNTWQTCSLSPLRSRPWSTNTLVRRLPMAR